MNQYGIILADNGSPWFISGAPDEKRDNDILRQLTTVPGSAFEAVDSSVLLVDVNSGQAKPWPPSYTDWLYIPLVIQ
jgi:hypothetical protein